MGWMLANTGFTRSASFLAQIALGWLLSDEDFGLFALAISLAAFSSLLRDAGVRQLLVARQQEYTTLLGPVFWMALAFNSAAGLMLVLAAPLAAAVYGEPSLVLLVLIIALAQPAGTPGAILTTRLRIDMRFRAISALEVGGSLIRYGGAVGLALAGFGPLSFVLPLPLVAAYEAIAAWWLTREHPWRCGARLRTWRTLFAQTRWVLLAGFAVALLNLGPNLAIGLFATTAVVGVLFFAFQIVLQIGMVLSSNIAQVLFSALAKIASEPQRKREAVLRSMRQGMLIAAPMSLGLAVTFPALEMLIWQGKWAAAAGAVQAFGFLYAVVIPQSIAHVAQQARAEFRGAALGLSALALTTVAVAAGGAVLLADPIGIALALGAGRAVASAVYTAWALRPLRIGALDIVKSNGPALGIAVVAGGLALCVDWSIAHWHPLVRLMVISAVFGAAYTLPARFLLRSSLLDLARTTPGCAGGLMTRVLLLPVPVTAGGPEAIHASRCTRCHREACACARSDREADAAFEQQSV